MKKRMGRLFLALGGIGDWPSSGTMASGGSLLVLAAVKGLLGGGWSGILALILGAGIIYFFSVRFIKRILTENFDQRWIVIDEVMGVMIAGLAMWIGGRFDFIYFLTTFAWFRLFDGWKFGIVKYFDDQDRAEGVMLDDVAAGIEAMAANLATILIFGQWL